MKREEPAFLRRLRVREHSVGWLAPCPDIHASSGFSVLIRADEKAGRYRFQCVDADPGDPCSNERQLVELLEIEESELSLNDDDIVPPALNVVTFEAFAKVEEEGAEPLLGDTENVLIPQGGNMMIYGDGGAGKTTLGIDLGCHLAAGDDWLGVQVDRPLRVLLLENEGPRPLFRGKAARKLAGWQGSPLEDRLLIVDEPWARFTFAEPAWRDILAAKIRDEEIDVVIVGPLTALGMLEAGTIPQVRAFADLLDAVRTASGRRVTFIVVHHENKGGKVSGAWEGVGEGLWHVQKRGHGRTALYFQKARWSSQHHGKTLELLWAEGESFEVDEREEKDDETVRAEILDYVREHPGTSWTKVREATKGVERTKQVELRDALLVAGDGLVNLDKHGEPATIRPQTPSRLYVADDPAVRHLGRASGPDAAQNEENLF